MKTMPVPSGTGFFYMFAAMKPPDSIIFDMDGTLWDAVDLYTCAWNDVLREANTGTQTSRAEMSGMIGWEGKKVMDALMPGIEEDRREQIFAHVNERQVLLSKDGCILYPGVIEGIAALSTRYKLFIVSNCAKGLITRFIEWAGISQYIIDEVAYGINLMPKNYNIKLLIDKHNLTAPVYVGDTDGDSKQSRIAGIPYVLVTYGFGSSNDYDLKFDDFPSLTSHFMQA